jgi:hypothetical protein
MLDIPQSGFFISCVLCLQGGVLNIFRDNLTDRSSFSFYLFRDHCHAALVKGGSGRPGVSHRLIRNNGIACREIMDPVFDMAEN